MKFCTKCNNLLNVKENCNCLMCGNSMVEYDMSEHGFGKKYCKIMAKSHSMIWYYILSYFLLYLNALNSIIVGIGIIIFSIFLRTTLGYIVWGLIGGLYILHSIVAIITSIKLINYKSNAPGLVQATYLISLIANLLFFTLFSIGAGKDPIIYWIGLLIGGGLIILLNNIYFGKRSDVFSNI